MFDTLASETSTQVVELSLPLGQVHSQTLGIQWPAGIFGNLMPWSFPILQAEGP